VPTTQFPQAVGLGETWDPALISQAAAAEAEEARMQEELIKQVFAANPRTVVVLRASFPYAINWTQEHVPAIVHTTNSSQEEGNALADVLFGDYNPGGKLVETWPKSLDQLPPMMDYDLRHGRTYMYFKGEPLYPFGFGLFQVCERQGCRQTSFPRTDRLW
jgi:beta-glucosidase